MLSSHIHLRFLFFIPSLGDLQTLSFPGKWRRQDTSEDVKDLLWHHGGKQTEVLTSNVEAESMRLEPTTEGMRPLEDMRERDQRYCLLEITRSVLSGCSAAICISGLYSLSQALEISKHYPFQEMAKSDIRERDQRYCLLEITRSVLSGCSAVIYTPGF
ncbi:hypothetical protein FN846DRAFT_586048 [Sphaerosporella brunnea]|uniref:Uncharacterized protein n=1 Tax=Sphaerosporella brunnea TaxID=1250544 RepID=A0A5J5ED34_9PEZI|nr:hypothetical protein FN846DRAFT_586048 [Sphaerosporella brunnea]